MNVTSNLLTVPEAAALLRVSEPTIRRWIGMRRLPAIRAGGAWRISRDDLLHYCAEATIRAETTGLKWPVNLETR